MPSGRSDRITRLAATGSPALEDRKAEHERLRDPVQDRAEPDRQGRPVRLGALWVLALCTASPASGSSAAARPCLRLLVLRDDPDREFDYLAGAEQALQLARSNGWTVVSIKDDWTTVF